MGGERGEEKGKRKRRERGGEGERKKGVGTVGLKPSQSKISGYVTGYIPFYPQFSVGRPVNRVGRGLSLKPPPVADLSIVRCGI